MILIEKAHFGIEKGIPVVEKAHSEIEKGISEGEKPKIYRVCKINCAFSLSNKNIV